MSEKFDFSILSADDQGTIQLFLGMVEPFYWPESDYHNLYEHVAEGFSEAMRLCDVAEFAGHDPNRLVVALAILGHDPAFNYDILDEMDEKWETKEAFQAEISGQLLRSLGIDEDQIGQVKKCIIATHVDATCNSIEEEIVRMADVSNVSNEYENFVLKSCEFFNECVARGADLDLDRFKEISAIVLGKYFDAIKKLVDLDKNVFGNSFVCRGRANIEQFDKETPETILQLLGRHAVRFQGTLSRTTSTEDTTLQP